MQRIVLVALFVAAIVAIGAVLARTLSSIASSNGTEALAKRGNAMQRVAFFLLLALMAYAIMSGAS